VTGQEGQEILAALGTVPQSIKDFLVQYAGRMTAN
jgi:hypothetical protein